MSVPLILVAASGLAREVLSSLEAERRYEAVGLLDDSATLQGTWVGGLPVLGPVSAATDHPEARLLICAGKGTARAEIVRRLASYGVGAESFATVVDPSVTVGSSCSVGPGSIVLAGTVLTADVHLGSHVVVMPHVTLTHDDQVDDFATLCAGVTLGGTVRVGTGCYVGMSAAVRENLTLGDWSTLGMGAVLTHDLPEQETWVGTPARPLERGGSDVRRGGGPIRDHQSAVRSW